MENSDTIFLADNPEMMGLAANCSELEFSAELMHSLLHCPELHAPYASVIRAPDGTHGGRNFYHQAGFEECELPASDVCFRNAVVRLSNGMQEWIYKVADYNLCRDSWIARWPD